MAARRTRVVTDKCRLLTRFVIPALASFSFVVLVDEYGAGKFEERGEVQARADDVGAALDLLVDPFQRIRGPGLPPVPVRK